MSLQKITFTNSTVSAQKDADFYYFLLNDIGVLRGIKHGLQVTNNVNRIVFKSGYVNIYGRMLFIEEDTTVTIPLDQVAYGYVIIRVNTSNNTAELTYKEGTANYPDLTQENIMQEFGIYEFALAKYSKTSSNLALQDFSPKYIDKKEPSYLGTENKDKILIVGNDGYIALQSKDDILVGKAKADEKGTNIANKFSSIDSSINDVNNDLIAHKDNNLNPHKVTASQVGAYSKSETDDKLSTKVTTETNKGLVTQQILANTDLNTVKTNGFYGISQSCTNKPINKDDGNLIVLQYDSSNIWTTQVYITLNLSENKNRIYSRGYNNSTNSWSSWKQIDNDPSLYNLGAYDTYVDNGDGTTTITRQTQYLNADSSLNWNVNATGSYGTRWLFYLPTTAQAVKANLHLSNDLNPTNKTFAYGYNFNATYNTFILCLPTSYNANTRTGLYEYLSKNPISIEYKLATPYTEKIITGVPQITLDKQGCEWLRSEWEKGLNLWNKYQGNMNEGANKASIKSNTDNKVIISVTSDKDPYIFAKQLVDLPSGIYTLSYNRSIGGSGTYAKVDGKYLVFSTTAEGVAYLTFTINSTTTIGIRLGGDISGNNADTTYTNFMLVKGSAPYSYQPYNSAYHITNEQADFLKQEYDLSCNLFETQMEIKLTAGSEQWRNRKISGLVVGKAYTLYAFDNNTYQGYDYQALPEFKSFKNRAYTFVADATIKEIRVGANTLSQNLDFTTKIMLIEGTANPSEFIPYNSSKYITNPQADLLVEEEEKSRNLLDENIYKFTNNYGINLGYCELKAKTTYCLSLASAVPGSQIKIIPSTSTQSILIANGDYSFQKQGTFTPTQDYNGVLALAGTYTDATIPSWAMLNRGSAALPYAAYNGSIIHEKQLSLQAPSMGSKVANECMMNVRWQYYNNSSSDKYILLGNITLPEYDNDGGFIINGTIGGYFYNAQAQINAVAYQRGGVKWKGSYTQDKASAPFNNISDLIITSTKKVYVVIKAGQFGQYNLQLQGKTIQYIGDVLDTIDGSIASTFSQSEAIDLTALDTGLSDKLKFINNNAITDPDGNGNYRIDNTYIYDEELATNGVDYTPFDGSSSYDSQSGINQDFYKQIKTNKENINSLRGRSLYVNTITMQFTSPDKAVVTLTILDTLPHDDPSSGTSWSFVRDYLNNKGYVLGSYTNWQKTNKVYPCSGSINISSSVQFPIVGISKDSSTNGLFWLHYLAYDGSPVAIAFSTVINSRAHSIQIF